MLLSGPVGLGATRAFVEALGQALGTSPRAAALASDETDGAVRQVRPYGLRLFRDAFGAWLGDPLLAPGATELLADLGCRIDVVAASAREAHDGPDTAARGACSWRMRWAPDLEEFVEEVVAGRAHARRFFGVVPPSLGLAARLAPLPCVFAELGFPSLDAHAIAARPYYGFAGVATLVERLGGLR